MELGETAQFLKRQSEFSGTPIPQRSIPWCDRVWANHLHPTATLAPMGMAMGHLNARCFQLICVKEYRELRPLGYLGSPYLQFPATCCTLLHLTIGDSSLNWSRVAQITLLPLPGLRSLCTPHVASCRSRDVLFFSFVF
jgi:hypothetical protein